MIIYDFMITSVDKLCKKKKNTTIKKLFHKMLSSIGRLPSESVEEKHEN